MEKLGVDVAPAPKEAADRKINPEKCPNCGSTLPPWEASNVPCCPQCGTKPWEREAK